MHALHDYIARQVAEAVAAHGVVVWYDSRGEFRPFVAELPGVGLASIGPMPVELGNQSASLIRDVRASFEVRFRAESLVSGERPEPLVIYLTCEPPPDTESVLAELEMAGYRYETSLKRLARNLLRQKFTDGVIDELLERPNVTYDDIARVAEGRDDGELPSVLKSIYHDIPARDDLLAAWLASDDRDEAIRSKGAVSELAKLLESRIGLEAGAIDDLVKLRVVARRYVLVGEFRDDLRGVSCAAIDGVAAPRTKPQLEAVAGLAERLRRQYGAAYVSMADQFESALGLAAAGIAADKLGSTDTFRFEERAVLSYVADLIAAASYDDADRLIAEREQSFWLDQEVTRRAQWHASRLMVDVGRAAATVISEASGFSGAPEAWIVRYADRDHGWHRLDQSQRRLETVLASLDDDPPERALGLVRRAYEDAVWRLAERFVPSLVKSGWSTGAVVHQSRVFADSIAASPKPVAYFLVDAMRYEMGVELAERLGPPTEATISAAVAALPSITPVGMSALMPGAAASYDVVEVGGKAGGRIDGVFLPDLTARRKFAEARIPALVDMTLAELMGTSAAKLAVRLKDAGIVIIRSQEIDAAGEGGFFQARRTMDTVLDDLVRAIRKIAAAGVRHAVVSADHGHLFAHGDREEAHRLDAPGGATVDLHRRCWIGRGGKTPAGAIRVSASALGYDSDLDFVFPPATAVFKAGGDLGYHHGGPSLQELVIPVVTVRTVAPSAALAKETVAVTAPAAITNRIFSATLLLGGANLSLFGGSVVVQPALVAAGRQVGKVAMAVGAELDAAAGTLTLEPGVAVSVGFILTDDSVSALRLVVLDPATDAELYKSPHDLPVNLGVI
jgi:hypothetical protein